MPVGPESGIEQLLDERGLDRGQGQDGRHGGAPLGRGGSDVYCGVSRSMRPLPPSSKISKAPSGSSTISRTRKPIG